MVKKYKKPNSEWRTTAFAGYSTIVLTFGILGSWAIFATLDNAIFAQGFVALETNHKTIQHLEGGIINEIFVNNGDHVQEGKVLLRLQKVQAQANSDLLNDQLDSFL